MHIYNMDMTYMWSIWSTFLMLWDFLLWIRLKLDIIKAVTLTEIKSYFVQKRTICVIFHEIEKNYLQLDPWILQNIKEQCSMSQGHPPQFLYERIFWLYNGIFLPAASSPLASGNFSLLTKAWVKLIQSFFLY